jgi:hypothetical protein
MKLKWLAQDVRKAEAVELTWKESGGRDDEDGYFREGLDFVLKLRNVTPSMGGIHRSRMISVGRSERSPSTDSASSPSAAHRTS